MEGIAVDSQLADAGVVNVISTGNKTMTSLVRDNDAAMICFSKKLSVQLISTSVVPSYL